MGKNTNKKSQSNRPSTYIKPKSKPIRSKPIATQKPHKVKKGMSFLGKVLALIATGITIFLGFLYFYPRISIDERDLIYPNSPFYYPFEVKNIGNIQIRDFSFSIHINDMTFNDNISIHNSAFVQNANDTTIPKIKINGRHPINIENAITSQYEIASSGGAFINKELKSAQIFIKYDYTIPTHLFHFTDSVNFFLLKPPNNKYVWKEKQ